MGVFHNHCVSDSLFNCRVVCTKPSCRLMMLPAIDKPGYFGFYLGGRTLDIDLDTLVADEQALRLALRKQVDREDLVFGKIDNVTSYRSVVSTYPDSTD